MPALDGHWGLSVLPLPAATSAVNALVHASATVAESMIVGTRKQRDPARWYQQLVQEDIERFAGEGDVLCQAALAFKNSLLASLNAEMRDPLFANIYQANKVCQSNVHDTRSCITITQGQLGYHRHGTAGSARDPTLRGNARALQEDQAGKKLIHFTLSYAAGTRQLGWRHSVDGCRPLTLWVDAGTGDSGSSMAHWADRQGVGDVNLPDGKGYFDHAVTEKVKAVKYDTISFVAKVRRVLVVRCTLLHC